MPRQGEFFQCIHSTCNRRPTWTEPNLQPRQLRRIPSAADGLDQQDAGIHSPPLNIDVIALICQQHRLRSNHLEIVVNPADISIRKQLQRSPRQMP